MADSHPANCANGTPVKDSPGRGKIAATWRACGRRAGRPSSRQMRVFVSRWLATSGWLVWPDMVRRVRLRVALLAITLGLALMQE